MEWSYKARNFWTMSATESQKAEEDNQNKNKLNDRLRFIVLLTQLAFFPFPRNKQIILDSYPNEIFFFYTCNKSFQDQA